MNTIKNLLIILACFFSSIAFSQAYSGNGDIKFSVGANLQADASGISASVDYGLGENISVGIKGLYLLGVEEYSMQAFTLFEGPFEDPELTDRFDLRARFSAHLSNVINIDENFDVYPGLDLGLKNFGAHLGARYFFTTGIGVFAEFNVPVARYKSDDDYTIPQTLRKELNNQFNVTFGVSFNI